MIRRLLIATACLLSFTFSFAQAPKKKTQKPADKAPGAAFFEKSEFRFGNIKEIDGPVTTTFTYTNIGASPLRILRVTAACGCTTPHWTTEPLKKGQKGTITVTFDPAGRPGEFYKALTVETDGDPHAVMLHISGRVDDVDLENRLHLPVVQGNIRLSTQVLTFDNLVAGKSDSQVVSVLNTSKKRFRITGVQSPPFIRVEFEPKGIGEDQKSLIEFVYYPEVANDLGPRMDEVRLITTDDSLPEKIFMVRANIHENFSGLTPEEKKNAPKLVLQKKETDLGEVYVGEVVEYNLEISNAGKSDLIIRKAGGSCGCTSAVLPARPLKKGKKDIIKVKFNAKGLRGKQEKMLMIYTNDPVNPVVAFTIKANIVIPGIDPTGN